MEIRAFGGGDEEGVVELWRVCELIRPWNDPHRDIDRRLAVDDDSFLVGVVDGRVVGSVMAGYDGHRGAALMEEAERRLGARGCPKVNLQIRSSNSMAVGFYRRLGYSTDDVVSLGKRLVSDSDPD